MSLLRRIDVIALVLAVVVLLVAILLVGGERGRAERSEAGIVQ